MKHDTVLIIDAEPPTTAMIALQNQRDYGIVVASSEKHNGLPLPKSEPFIIRNSYPIKERMTDDWVCKGKHQYRFIGNRKIKEGEFGTISTEIWQCQCGKNL